MAKWTQFEISEHTILRTNKLYLTYFLENESGNKQTEENRHTYAFHVFYQKLADEQSRSLHSKVHS